MKCPLSNRQTKEYLVEKNPPCSAAGWIFSRCYFGSGFDVIAFLLGIKIIKFCLINKDVQKLIRKYCNKFNDENGFLFINKLGNRLSEQSVRNMITKYAEQCGITQHITPHMFRHSFATLLLEEDVDNRYIQQMLGHSSITTTQIYTHTSISKQKSILTSKHPRNKLNINNQIKY